VFPSIHPARSQSSAASGFRSPWLESVEGMGGDRRSPNHAWEAPRPSSDGALVSKKRAERWAVHKTGAGRGSTATSSSVARSAQSKKAAGRKRQEGDAGCYMDEGARAEWFDAADRMRQPKPGRLADYTLSPSRAGMSQPPQNPRVMKDLLEYFASTGVKSRIQPRVPSPRLHLVRPAEREALQRAADLEAMGQPSEQEFEADSSQTLPQIHPVSSLDADQAHGSLDSASLVGSLKSTLASSLRDNRTAGSKDKGGVKFRDSVSGGKGSSSNGPPTNVLPSALRRTGSTGGLRAPPASKDANSVARCSSSSSSLGSNAGFGAAPSSASGSFRSSMASSGGVGKNCTGTRSLPCLSIAKQAADAGSTMGLADGTTPDSDSEAMADDFWNSNKKRSKNLERSRKRPDSRQLSQDYRAPGTPTEDQMRWMRSSLKKQSRLHGMNFLQRPMEDALDLTLHHNKAARIVTDKHGGFLEKIPAAPQSRTSARSDAFDYSLGKARCTLRSLRTNFTDSVEKRAGVHEEDVNRPAMIKEMKAIMDGIRATNGGCLPPAPQGSTRSRLAHMFREVANIARMAASSTGILEHRCAGERFKRVVQQSQVLIAFRHKLRHMDSHGGDRGRIMTL